MKSARPSLLQTRGWTRYALIHISVTASAADSCLSNRAAVCTAVVHSSRPVEGEPDVNRGERESIIHRARVFESSSRRRHRDTLLPSSSNSLARETLPAKNSAPFDQRAPANERIRGPGESAMRRSAGLTISAKRALGEITYERTHARALLLATI